MKRLYQGHLHFKLEVPRLTCLGQESNPTLCGGREHASKELFEQHVNSYSEHLLYIWAQDSILKHFKAIVLKDGKFFKAQGEI